MNWVSLQFLPIIFNLDKSYEQKLSKVKLRQVQNQVDELNKSMETLEAVNSKVDSARISKLDHLEKVFTI